MILQIILIQVLLHLQSINESNYSSTTFDLNYTFVETNPDVCWYSNDSGGSNSSYVVVGTNWTDLTDSEGNHNRTIYCNDTSGNNNQSVVSFTLDTSPPYFSAITNQTLMNTTTLNYDIDAFDSYTDVGCFTVNNTGNFSIDCDGILTNATVNPVGIFYLNITVNDSLNNLNSTIMFVNYTSTDVNNPNIEITFPTNNSNVTHHNITINYTSFDSHLDTCWYSNDSYAVNTTLASCINITGVTWIDGQHNLTVWVNDSANNINSSSVTFYVDTDSTVTFCRDLNIPNMVYTLQYNLITNKTCFNIKTNNITIDFNGYNVSGDCGFWYDGIIISNYNNTLIENGRLDSFYHQIYANGAYNTNITNMTFNGSCYGDLYGSIRNSSIKDVVGLNGTTGFRISSENNTLDNLNMSSYSGQAIVIAGSYNTIKNSFSRFTDDGLYVMARYNNFTNNTFESNPENGVRLESNSDGNRFINNTFWNCSTGGNYACIYVDNSDDCVFEGNTISNSSRYGIWINSDFTISVNNTFKNSNITEIAGTSVYLEDTGGLNNTFLNMSYNNESVDAGSELVRKWYFSAQVNYTHNNTAVYDSNVTAYNSSSKIQGTSQTNSNGNTSLFELIEYINNGTKMYYTNYTFTASKISWATDSQSINLTINLLNQQFNISDILGVGGGGGGGGLFTISGNLTEPTTELNFGQNLLDNFLFYMIIFLFCFYFILKLLNVKILKERYKSLKGRI